METATRAGNWRVDSERKMMVWVMVMFSDRSFGALLSFQSYSFGGVKTLLLGD